MGNMQVLHRLPHLGHILEHRPRIVSGTQRNELLPAIAGEEIRRPMQPGGNGLGHCSQDLIPGRVAEGIIIGLEVVDIKHTDGKRQAEADRGPPFHHGLLLIAPPVGHACQHVQGRLLLKLHLVVV